MPTPDDIAAQQRRLAAQRQALGDLLVQQTSLDAHTPPYIRRRGRNVVVLALGLIGLDVLLLIGVLMLAVLAVMAANNALSDTPYLLLIPVSIAGLVLSAWQVWPVFVANVIGLGLVTALITRTTPLSYLDVQVLQDALAVLTIMGLISFLGASSTTRALRTAQSAREQAEAAAMALDSANTALEMRVAERTAELAGALTAQRNQATELQISLDRQQILNDLLNALSLPIIPVREDVLVAQTLVSLGADLSSLHTAATLQEGLAAVSRVKSYEL